MQLVNSTRNHDCVVGWWAVGPVVTRLIQTALVRYTILRWTLLSVCMCVWAHRLLLKKSTHISLRAVMQFLFLLQCLSSVMFTQWRVQKMCDFNSVDLGSCPIVCFKLSLTYSIFSQDHNLLITLTMCVTFVNIILSSPYRPLCFPNLN